MIEVLNDNELVDLINRTKKKVSIKHYLNTYLFPVGDDGNGNQRYPVYYRIIFNRQSVKLKSNTNLILSKIEFEQLTEQNWKLLTREALFLTYLINRIYNNVLTETNRYSEPFQMGIENFDINQIFHDFNFGQYELPSVVNRILLSKMELFSKNNNLNEITFDLLSTNFNAYQLLTFLKLGNNIWGKFEKEYNSLIWFFNIEYATFKSESTLYDSFGATEVDLLFLDFSKSFSDKQSSKEHSEFLLELDALIRSNKAY
ncbi:hypothetical protein EGI31_04910 [Lacihabitans soyangensis]|uniref:Uncharacterized protein n=2 Tax=Lacihabitans soyangensis TaxID=869394 RepID=A0AAE3H3L6_9BACT|nr:hypothetical protein [Lacihabitans soyangensis]